MNTNILLVLHPLDVRPMGPIPGDPHRLRPERPTRRLVACPKDT